MNNDKRRIKSLKAGHTETLDELYRRYRSGFLEFCKRYAVAAEVALDIYQDSIIVLYENSKQGKLDELKSSIKTYLYAIGKYKMINYLNEQSRHHYQELQGDELVEELTLFETDTSESRLQLLRQAYLQLGPKCQEVLRLFYYEGLKLDAIQKQLAYDSKDTVKSQKSRCLKQLKQIVHANGKR
ncbi:RNA polymerase sigma factor [Parapedobacter deserti]|uniref:RNA polymerase sigma factor n=1 Tax=Parapedobacter deserti TaxID=1912957 RepID=A0ABV7JLD1_9SPHI